MTRHTMSTTHITFDGTVVDTTVEESAFPVPSTPSSATAVSNQAPLS